MHFRSARHTNQLQLLIDFYTRILGLEILGSFQKHDQYDGVFLGFPGRDWHLEFTTSNIPAEHQPDADDILVFYPETAEIYDAIKEQISQQGIELHVPANPYWKIHGIMVKDPDGYFVVISNSSTK